MPTPEPRTNAHNAANYASIDSQMEWILLTDSFHEKQKIAGNLILYSASGMDLGNHGAFGPEIHHASVRLENSQQFPDSA